MKKYGFVLSLVLFSIVSKAQYLSDQKGDYTWIFDFGYIKTNPNAWKFDFNAKPMQPSTTYKLLNAFNANANISDNNGNLLFYTNACAVADAQNRIIEGGERIGSTPETDFYCAYGRGEQPIGGFLIFSSTNEDSTHYMFHLRSNWYFDKRIGVSGTDGLLLTKIKQNNNSLKVIFKDSILLNYPEDDVLIDGHLTACRHANGRDWWILQPKLFEKDYHLLLFSPNGIAKRQLKNIGGERFLYESGDGMSVFSPDGKKYVSYNDLSNLQIFNFDRCSGELSNFKQIFIKDDKFWTGCAISPNSKYLYVMSSTKMYQYDLLSDSIETTKYTFERDTTFLGSNGKKIIPDFWTAQLGPDGKIYIGGDAIINYMHVINKPDLPGAACEFKQFGLNLPIPVSYSIPFFPNYRLGALKGSPCDTLNTTPTNEIIFEGTLKVYPNPASEYIKVDLTLPDFSIMDAYTLQMVDVLGKVQRTKTMSKFASLQEISVDGLPVGIYCVQLINSFGSVLTQTKVVVAR